MSVREHRERPDALDLLATARETLVEAVIPALEGEVRYQALMVASALGLAERELVRAREDDDAGELAMLETLYGDVDPRREDEDDEARLARLLTRLAADLRSGELDGGPQLCARAWRRHSP